MIDTTHHANREDAVELTKRRINLPAVIAIAAAAAIIAVVLATNTPSAKPAPTQLINVSIRGNLGGFVIVDGQETTKLIAYDGTDHLAVNAAKSVHVTVESTGETPWCHIDGSNGVTLQERFGVPPHPAQQTVFQGYGPAQVVEVPSHETVACDVTVNP